MPLNVGEDLLVGSLTFRRLYLEPIPVTLTLPGKYRLT